MELQQIYQLPTTIKYCNCLFSVSTLCVRKNWIKVDKSSVIEFDWGSTDLETFRMDREVHDITLSSLWKNLLKWQEDYFNFCFLIAYSSLWEPVFYLPPTHLSAILWVQSIQWGLKYQTFKYRIHSKSEHFWRWQVEALTT